MADVSNKYPQNVNGKFYVDNQCIDCDLCREVAPDNFTRDDDGGHSFVFKQPSNSQEEAKCQEAKNSCPVDAIGDNG
jgi:ferredoxin